MVILFIWSRKMYNYICLTFYNWYWSIVSYLFSYLILFIISIPNTDNLVNNNKRNIKNNCWIKWRIKNRHPISCHIAWRVLSFSERDFYEHNRKLITNLTSIYLLLTANCHYMFFHRDKFVFIFFFIKSKIIIISIIYIWIYF